MTGHRGKRYPAKVAAAIIAALLLHGCASNDPSSAVVSPKKYAYYNCQQLLIEGKQVAEREEKLRLLMAQAEQGAGGGLVNTLAYESDYLTVRGELKQLELEADEKNCPKTWRSQSDRSIR